MIFKNLFTPKWKHPKTQVRLAAVDKLDTSKDAEVLHTLALEDDSSQIRKKVLDKINDLSLWWKVYKQDQELKELAEQHISQAVLSGSGSLSQEIRNEYIDRYAPAKTLEKVAFSDIGNEQKAKLLKRLANAKLIEKAFKEGDEPLQVALLPLVAQYQLEKAVLKAASGEALTTLEQTLEQQRLSQVMPAQIAQEAKLILAKLNALRDKQDYQVVASQADALSAQWQALEVQWLSEEAQQLNQEKFATITQKLNKHRDTLQQAFEQAQQQAEQAAAKAAAISEFEAGYEALEQALSSAVEALNLSAQEALHAQLSELQSRIQASQYQAEPALKALSGKLRDSASALESLPELVSAKEQFDSALKALAGVAPSEELEQFDTVMAAQKQAYQHAHSQLRRLPVALKKQASEQLKEASNEFNQTMKPLVDAQEKYLKEARKKARDVQRLLDQGRFNVAFGVFNGFMESYELLSEGYKQHLAKQHSALSEALKELKDWQKYASQPKRAELLQQLDEMLTEQEVDPKARAAQVKLLRVRWNELGRVESEEEKAQAAQFDEKIELLFAPCRAYFAEQDAQRKKIIEQREALVEQMTELLGQAQSAEPDWRQVESTFNRVNKQWRGAGSLDAATYQALNARYRAAYTQVNEQLKSRHQANAQLKQQLVNEAQAQLELEDVVQACDTLKNLQKRWQEIGFAGTKQEHTLWQEFRKHNDAVFGKRQAQQNAEREQAQTQETQQRQLLAELDSQMIDAKTQSELLSVKDAVLATDVLGSLKKTKQQLLEQVEVKLNELYSAQSREKFNELVEAVRAGDTPPGCWLTGNDSGLSAEQLLLRLEVMTNNDSPQALQQDRMAQQVALLEAKLQGGAQTLEYYLNCYLSQVVNDSEQLEQERLIKVLTA
ncbi:DUF349 domain-containing protein [Pseudoalteromonas sp. DL2-H2.2]|uniref:DUF349 domain-containing protein n=1 Tax=Pseudoalteromonas sp. DL2-H2.2 TaxID=2908889 RepID=UPI001F19FBCC|nr:DUF349 domain-containing protein [Pseudoalteromonas sp. DL2-H2.2]MCF2909003.1 DUF349 domain-containing protein [Pseudoalteromonas sp. DL2-H2.2]